VLGEFIRHFLAKEPIPGIDAEYAFVKQVLPEITLADVNKLTGQLTGGQQKFVLVTGPEKRDVPVPANDSLLSIADHSSSIEVKPYEEKKVEARLIDRQPDKGKIVSETKDADLGITKLTLNNGVTVTLKSTNFKNDEILLSSSRYGGNSLYGIADKYNALVAGNIVTEMGVKDMTPVELQKYLSGKTVRANPYISETTEGYSGSSSVKDFETLLQLIYLYATQPRKDDELFKSFITKQKTMMSGFLQNPNFSFQDTLNKVLTQNNPRAVGLLHPEDFDKIDENRSFDIYKERLSNADGLNFYIIGSLDLETMKPLIVAYLGSLPAKPAVHQYKDLGIRSPKGVVKFSFKKGKEQKSLAILSLSSSCDFDPDENVKLQAAVEVLQIKVIEKLREEMGGVYGASVRGAISKMPYSKYNISFNIPCGPENVDKLIAATLELISKLKNDGPSDADLAKVKETWKKKYEEDIKTNNYWLSILSSSAINKTDPKRILTYEKRVDALTIEDIKKAAVKYFDLNNYVTAILLPE
jgi:zinc protease